MTPDIGNSLFEAGGAYFIWKNVCLRRTKGEQPQSHSTLSGWNEQRPPLATTLKKHPNTREYYHDDISSVQLWDWRKKLKKKTSEVWGTFVGQGSKQKETGG